MRNGNRLRTILLFILIALFIAALFMIPAYTQREKDETILEITCISAQSNIAQLTALDEIADQLGVPHTFMPPELPEECP